MKKFLIGLFTGLVLTILAGVILLFSVMRLGEGRPKVEDGSTLVLKLDGDIPEKAPVSFPIPFLGGKPPLTVRDIWSMLHKAAADSRVKAIIVEPSGVHAGWGKLQEIHADLLQFKKSGKPLIAFLRRPKTRDYYLATAADQIYMTPEDYLDMKGLRAEMMYFKQTLDKVGVSMEVEHIGKYKDFGDMFTETSSTPETKEVMNSLLDSIYGDMLRTFAAGRKKEPEQMRAILDDGPFTGKQALAKGLIDKLRYEDQVYGETKDLLKQSELKKLRVHDYARVSGASLGVEGKKKIALVVGEGNIVSGSGDDAMGTDEGFSSGAFSKMLREVGNDKNISGVILRVDSPGGDAIASDEMLREVRLLSKKKPMVVSMSDVAASGGYYISMTGDPVLAYAGTYTGSIGVVFLKPNLRGLYDKLGIQKDIMARGKNADIDSDYHPMTPEARAKLRQSLEDFYKDFVTNVANGRKRRYEEVEPLSQGRVWLGSQAKAQGLVDEIGGLDRAVELVKQKANIRADEKIQLLPYPPKRSLIEQWIKSTSDTSVEGFLRTRLKGLDYRLWMQGGVMRIMPYFISIE
ncbi:MAG TPA: signal peptide peptidase SppA [Bryobacteraceae bacterium]|nr:signal peptide peptidase SppA [Bryobacteraceae bacterium]